MSGLSSNEIEVRDPARREEDGQRCLKLLEDDSLLWILLIGQSAQIVPHVVALAETVKRQRYKASGEELKQFIDDDGAASSGDKYATPTSIKIYLSRIDDLAAFLPNYKPKIAPPKPPIRPPIVFGSSPSSSATERERERNSKLKKGSKEDGGGLFGFGRR
ncbi:hypothetical protein BCR35DRAFT_51660 [Leucosporidium creatinivorum]|uniref:Uncharacterized protein n=1 Tax=Leucosporidium creatinivorum TaxID=106004 RepID=A0A1Y2BTT3_9BASI|nr:hypothetical protein BCR35DRAFT_51660 [Leucosporidium creatinivorum]